MDNQLSNMRLHEQIAQRIIADFLADGMATRLPSIDELARWYHVAYMTAWKAVDQLARQKAIDRKHGRRSSVPGISGSSDAHASGRPDDAPSLIESAIAAGIENATYHAGEPLPKIAWFTAEFAASRNTVSHALSELSNKNLIHKAGRQWIVGPAPERVASRGPRREAPAALLAFADEFSWLIAFNNNFFAGFIGALRTELMKQGVRLSVVLRERPQQGERFIRWGLDAARSCIEKLGNRYRGALMIEVTPEREGFISWVRELSCRGKLPVIYFDSADYRPDFTRANLSLGKYYFRLGFDERSAVRCALQHLVDHGHRTIGFPVFPHGMQAWTTKRLALARELAQQLTPRSSVLSAEMAEPFWDTDLLAFSPQDIIRFNERLQAHADACAPRAGATLSAHRAARAATPSLASLLDKGATALLAMNDRVGFQYLWWADAAGIEVPRHLSIAAFDNVGESEALPLTTVDFGFARLGYLAAHILIGDIPVRADEAGNIPGTCTLIDRGSAGNVGRIMQ